LKTEGDVCLRTRGGRMKITEGKKKNRDEKNRDEKNRKRRELKTETNRGRRFERKF
jgi:hypothetical protein